MGKKLVIGENDLQTWCFQNNRKDILDAWDYDVNAIKPTEISFGSHKKINWICLRGHKYAQSPLTRINDHGCPICAKDQKYSLSEQIVFYYIHRAFPDAVNNEKEIIRPFELDVYIPSKRTAIEYDGLRWHEDKMERDLEKNRLCKKNKIKLIRIREEGCPDISECKQYTYKKRDYVVLSVILKKIICSLGCDASNIDIDIERARNAIESMRLQTINDNSLSTKYPGLLREWDYDANMGIDPEIISHNSGKKVNWICALGHRWSATVANRVSCGSGCPYCVNKKVLAGFNDLASKCPDLMKEWDFETNNANSLDPKKLIVGSNKLAAWICSKGHKYTSMITRRACEGRGCPYCSSRKILSGYNDLASQRPELLNVWDYGKNEQIGLDPEKTAVKSKRKAWWKCEKGHSYEMIIADKTHKGYGCPKCSRNRKKGIL